MSREVLSSQFWQACKKLRQDDNTNSLIDYVEQISWLLFLKSFEELEKRREEDAIFNGDTYDRVIPLEFSWSTWAKSTPALSGQDLINYLYQELLPTIRSLQGGDNTDRAVIRALFEETPSKMLKDGAVLRDAIDLIDQIEFGTAEDTYTLSYLYESMLNKLGKEGGMGGEFYTPRAIIEFVIQFVAPQFGQTIYDPAMGSAGFLVEAYKYVKDSLHDPILPAQERILQNSFFGQEKKTLPYLLGCMNMILHGVLTPSLVRKNTLSEDIRDFTENDRFDIILTNPPFGGTEQDSILSNFWYPSKATSITFLQHIMAKVRRGGKVGMVIDEGVLFKTNDRAYVDTKKALLENFNLHTIISLPAGVFANSVASPPGPKTDLIFFDREIDVEGQPVGTKDIWYYEVDAVGFSLTKTQKVISENDLPDCLEKSRTRAISERSWIVSIGEIIANGYDMSAHNPHRKDVYEYRTPQSLAADMKIKTERILEVMNEMQLLLVETGEIEADIDEGVEI